MFEITKGKIKKAQKVVLYGPEGIGKSTFGSKMPDPLFIDTEGSTIHLDVKRFDKPQSWAELLQMVDYVKKNPTICNTLVIDTADWAETLAIKNICSSKGVTGIEDFGYGKGYTYLAEEFSKLLNSLTDLTDLGINVLVLAHAQMRKFEQPDEMGAYDRWELKLQKKTAPLLKEWADAILFANYRTTIITDPKTKSKKATGGQRMVYTNHHPAWDAKNRWGLQEELPLDGEEIISHLYVRDSKEKPQEKEEKLFKAEEKKESTVSKKETVEVKEEVKNEQLRHLMNVNKVSVTQIEKAVEKQGFFPKGTRLKEYPEDFIKQVLVDNWEKVLESIKNN